MADDLERAAQQMRVWLLGLGSLTLTQVDDLAPKMARAALVAARAGEVGEPTYDECREAYEAWRTSGKAMHQALLAIWRTLGEDRKHMSYGEDPRRVVDEVLAVRAAVPTVTAEQVDAAVRSVSSADGFEYDPDTVTFVCGVLTALRIEVRD